MAGWVSCVVEEKIYDVEAICEYECSCWEPFGVFATIKSEYNFAMRILGIEVGKQQF